MAITYKRTFRTFIKCLLCSVLDVVGFGFSLSCSVFGAGAGCID